MVIEPNPISSDDLISMVQAVYTDNLLFYLSLSRSPLERAFATVIKLKS